MPAEEQSLVGSGLPPPVRAFRALLLVAQRLRYLMDARLRADGVTTQQAALLTVVGALGSPTLGEAAKALGSTHQNVAQLVAALERKGWLVSAPDPADRRRRLLSATEKSAAYWAGRDAEDFDAVAEWFSMLSEQEVETLADLAVRVAAGLDSAVD
ncbi:MarR family winged helix-turn-helix transcriptional regulator [Cryptosporangium sp. NPDC051539]|uniref:MarR family winged helix-turn-helix transcriptional regulator n=1 Tax=Cryptosporangium sp. NPDC051539 TaxID=3363962 RepID=UPI00379E9579